MIAVDKPFLQGDFLQEFQTISLEELNTSASLMRRMDKKYAISRQDFENVISHFKERYRILSIAGERIFQYQSVYFDTPGLFCYHQHHNGRARRFKLRKRTYINSGVSYWEIKLRDPKEITTKVRQLSDELIVPSTLHQYLQQDELEAIQVKLQPVLTVTYDRITFVSRDFSEKVTFDFNLRFDHAGSPVAYSNLVIAEVKTARRMTAPFCSLMKSIKIRQGSLSKYCLGIISVTPGVKQNNFKKRYTKIKRINGLAIARNG